MPPYDRERIRRRNRRLALLGMVIVILFGAFATAYAIQRNRNDAATRQRIVDSKMAFDNNEYERVIELLEDRNAPNNTLRIMQGDAEAMWHYVVARQNVSLPNYEHIRLLFPALRQVVTLDPGNREAGQILLGILMGGDRNTEALDTATRLIAAHPDDAELLRIRAAIHKILDHEEDALQDALAATEIEPLDVRTQMDVANLLRDLDRDTQEYYDRAEALLEANPTDPRAEVIFARANTMIEDKIEAQRLLRQASEREPPDEDFVHIIVEALDHMNNYVESYAYLERVTGEGLTTALQFQLFFRDFEAEHNQAVIDRFSSLDRESAHPNLLALTALCYHRLGEADQARGLVALLEQREDDALAQHWNNSLTALWDHADEPGRLVQALTAATQDTPNDAYLNYLLAQAYYAVGERESAIAALNITRKHRPSWAHPYFLRSQILLELGRAQEAAAAARNALRRQPVPAYAAAFAVAQARAVNTNDQRAIDRALSYIDDEVLTQFPDNAPAFVAGVELLARIGQPDRAAQRIRTALERETPLPQGTLLELVKISRRYRLRMDQAIYATAQAAYRDSAPLMLDQAFVLAQRGQPQDAIAFFRDAMPSPATLHWRVAEAQLLHHISDPSATAAWIAMANDFPEQLQVQKLALAVVGIEAGEGRRAFADEVIDRMKALTGPDSIGWKIERARFLLGSSNPAESEEAAAKFLNEVIVTAPNRVEPYRLLTTCMQLRGDSVAAIRNIEMAARLAPNDMRVQYQLGQLQHEAKNFIAARQPLLNVASDESADYNLRLNALILLSRNGERQREIETLIPILQKMQRQYAGSDMQQILLSNLYRITGRADELDELCERMLQNPTPQVIDYVAGYYWQTGRRDASNRVVALVGEVEMSDDTRHTILGWHAYRSHQADETLEHFRAAARFAPDLIKRWRNLVAVGLKFGKPEEAIADAQEARGHHRDDPAMNAVADNAPMLMKITGDLRFRPLAVSIVKSDSYRTVAVRALSLIETASGGGQSTASVANDLAALADQNPAFAQLQHLSAAMLSDVHQYRAAAEISIRTMQMNPNDSLSARLATVALASTGDWRLALNAAQSWGRRAPSQKPQADLFVSRAQRNLSHVTDALATLAPYAEQALSDPDANGPLLSEYAIVLVLDGQADNAWQLVLEPNIARSAGWRQLAMDLASTLLPRARKATAWLEAIEAVIPADATAERLQITRAHFRAGDRLRDRALVERAQAQIEQITIQNTTDADAWLLRGRIADSMGDLQNAEAGYRRALQLNPDIPKANNNLAMVLHALGRNMDEAIRLARRAIQGKPQDINYQDTLAQVLSRAGQHEEALRIIDEVIQRDRQNLSWIHTKAALLEAAGQNADAQRLRENYNLTD